MGANSIGSLQLINLSAINAIIGNLAVTTLKVAGNTIDEDKRRLVASGSLSQTGQTVNANSNKWWSITIVHNFGRRAMVSLSLDANTQGFNANISHSIYTDNNGNNSFEMWIEVTNTFSTGLFNLSFLATAYYW